MSYKFQRSLEAATDQTLIEPNWEAILECVDMIRGGELPVKESLKYLQKRYHNTNPHISHHALLILEACVKNCGKKFVSEVATKEFMDDLKSMIISNPPEKIREKLLELIQCWTSAFKGIPEFKIVEDTHSLLKMNGFEFPPIDEAKAMFLADSAPDWAEGDNCYRCRVEFGVFTRKHHCRACGQIFCDKCSNKQTLLPQFGIEKKVRVCEACFDKRSNSQTVSKMGQRKGIADDRTKLDEEARDKARKEAEEKEQEELQLALAISQSEAEAKEREKWTSLYSSQQIGVTTEPTLGEGRIHRQQTENDPQKNNRDECSLSGMADDSTDQPFDSMLAKYLDRDYWERKRRETEEAQVRATAPPPSEVSISVSSSVSQQPQLDGIGKGGIGVDESNTVSSSTYTAFHNNQPDVSSPGTPLLNKQQQIQQQKQQQFAGGDELSALYSKMDLSEIIMPQKAEDNPEAEEDVAETSEFCRTLKERVDTLSTRMRSNQLRGRSIVNDSAIHSLFSQLTDAHAKVLERMTALEGQREHYESMQDNLTHITEARQAVNALRDENERQRREMLKAEQDKRQSQLKQKMEHMRHKKHEMLLNERHLAVQRFQHNERQILQQRMMGQQLQQMQQYQTPHLASPHQQTVYQQMSNSMPPNVIAPMPMASMPQNGAASIGAPMPPNMTVSFPSCVTASALPNVTAPLPSNIVASVPPSNITTSMLHNVPPNVTTSMVHNVPPNITTSVLPNVPAFQPTLIGQHQYAMHQYLQQQQQQYIPMPLPFPPNVAAYHEQQLNPTTTTLAEEQTKNMTGVQEDLLISFD